MIIALGEGHDGRPALVIGLSRAILSGLLAGQSLISDGGEAYAGSILIISGESNDEIVTLLKTTFPELKDNRTAGG